MSIANDPTLGFLVPGKCSWGRGVVRHAIADRCWVPVLILAESRDNEVKV
jgi:hypothetical protein